jgi:hypothetical protein
MRAGEIPPVFLCFLNFPDSRLDFASTPDISKRMKPVMGGAEQSNG